MNCMEEASKDERVKDEPICYSQSISNTREATSRTNQPIKQEKRTKEDISRDDQLNKRI